MRTAIILLLACAAGCGAERVLESGAYLCTTSHDCGYGWTCAESPTPLYRLHVLERGTMETTTHCVLLDPECPDCRPGA